jgi:hypothetical protein
MMAVPSERGSGICETTMGQEAGHRIPEVGTIIRVERRLGRYGDDPICKKEQ